MAFSIVILTASLPGVIASTAKMKVTTAPIAAGKLTIEISSDKPSDAKNIIKITIPTPFTAAQKAQLITDAINAPGNLNQTVRHRNKIILEKYTAAYDNTSEKLL